MNDIAQQMMRLARGLASVEHLEKADGMLSGVGKFVVRKFRRLYSDTSFKSRVETDWDGNTVTLDIGTDAYSIEVEALFDGDEFQGTKLYLKSGSHKVKRGFFRRKYPTVKSITRLLDDHRAMVMARQRTASKEVMFHGTKLKHLRGILKQGLIPDASEQAWAEDEHEGSNYLSRVSYDGTYLTTNFMKAKSSAPVKQGIIVAVQVETKTLLPDEDSLTSGLMRGVLNMNEGTLMNDWMATLTWADIKKGKATGNVGKAADRILDSWLYPVENKKAVSFLKKSVKPLVEELVMEFMDLKIAWIAEEYREEGDRGYSREYEIIRWLEDKGLSVDDIPVVSEARRNFRSTFDKVMRKLKILVEDADDMFYSARTVDTINYRGANRVLAIMVYDRSGDVNTLSFPYGEGTSAAKKLIAEWEKSIGSTWEKAA